MTELEYDRYIEFLLDEQEQNEDSESEEQKELQAMYESLNKIGG